MFFTYIELQDITVEPPSNSDSRYTWQTCENPKANLMKKQKRCMAKSSPPICEKQTKSSPCFFKTRKYDNKKKKMKIGAYKYPNTTRPTGLYFPRKS